MNQVTIPRGGDGTDEVRPVFIYVTPRGPASESSLDATPTEQQRPHRAATPAEHGKREGVREYFSTRITHPEEP